MKRNNPTTEAFACIIVCILAVSLSLICAAGWLL